jgi:DNA repair exonuclease SbcCD ATPase subunit
MTMDNDVKNTNNVVNEQQAQQMQDEEQTLFPKWTILAVYTNNEDMTAFVQNWGWDEKRLVKELKNAPTNGFEKDISAHELLVLLKTVITNYNIIGVYNVSNHYNEDMTEIINPMKRSVELKLKSNGYKIIPHCNVKIQYSKDCEKVYTTRALIKLYSDQLNQISAQCAAAENENAELQEENNEWQNKNKAAQSEFNEWNNKIAAIITRYRNGERCCAEIEKRQHELENTLPDEVKELVNKKTSLDDEIAGKKQIFADIENRVKDKQAEEERLDNNINVKTKKLNSIEDDIEKKENEIYTLQHKHNAIKHELDELLETINLCDSTLTITNI